MTCWRARRQRERMSATVAGAVSGMAVLLALIGVHGALAYSVARRTREIGVRLAIGATPAAAARSVMREGILVLYASAWRSACRSPPSPLDRSAV